MSDQIKLLWKILTGEMNTLKAVWKLICTTIGYISSFFSLAVLLKDIVGWNNLEVWTKEQWQLLVIIGFLVSCIHNRKKINCSKKVSNRDMQIAISVRDIFSNKAANSFVIPTNTFFRTKMDNDYISIESVQGRFQSKYFKRNVKDLDAMISASLTTQGIIGKETADCFGLVMKYPIGTVAKVDYKGKHFYFIAINDVNEYGRPIGQTITNVTTALSAVVNAIQRIGHCDTLCIPLIGSGKAAIQEATKEIVCQKTIDYFVQSEDKVVSKLIISICPRDYLNGEIDLERMERYLDYKCEFY